MTLTDWQVVLLSMLPITELRATIPLALAWGMTPLRAYIMAVSGNLVPIIPLLLILEPLSSVLRYFPWWEKLFQRWVEGIRFRAKEKKTYGFLGLLLFVAIPLPGTGVWSGAALAWLLGMPFKEAALALALGAVCAGFAVVFASVGLIKLSVVMGFEYVLASVFLLALVWVWRKRRI